jgi:TFIIF-interacting CTD phosphatase-like protein
MKHRHLSLKKNITRKLVESSSDFSSQRKGTASIDLGTKSMGRPAFEEISNFNINRKDTFFHNMKVLDYQDQVALVFRQIFMIKDLIEHEREYTPLQEDEKIDFQFTKLGFKKLLIFDLDETLIHVKRDIDTHDFEPEVEIFVDEYARGGNN